jgi:hypothetical protein
MRSSDSEGSLPTIPWSENPGAGHRGAIEQAASAKFDEGDIEPNVDPKIVVTARDMASPLSRKF